MNGCVEIMLTFISGRTEVVHIHADSEGWWKWTEPHDGLPLLIISPRGKDGHCRHEIPVANLQAIMVKTRIGHDG